jgi:hypothetical protein
VDKFAADVLEAKRAAGGSFTGIHLTPLAEPSLARLTANATAFVGRALRGPINTPIYVTSFAEYQQIFGGLWQPSPLAYAVEHFFEQGGRRAVIVRVVNGAAPVTLKISCASEFLFLEAKAPGTREYLRASIDYDNIGGADTERFNLVVQRVRAAGSERIDEQEIFRGLSMNPLSPNFLSLALVESNLVRVRGAVPSARPNSTMTNATFLPLAYIESNPDGDDGAPLTDYDIIGSASRRTGIFALAGLEDVGFIYIPPLSRTQDVGVTTLVVAARFSRAHRAILIVDPPSTWTTCGEAAARTRQLAFRSEHAVMFFPRVATLDKLRGRPEIFGNGGAVAGALARMEEMRPVWAMFAREPELTLRGSLRLACSIGDAERTRLAANGLNSLMTGRASATARRPIRTLAGGAHSSADWGYLSALRFAHMVVRSIERGTRWVVGATRDPVARRRVVEQLEQFFSALAEAGAFPNAPGDRPYAVVCDERLNSAEDLALGNVHILVHFAALHPGEFHGYMITHQPQGSTAMPVAVNTLELPGMPLEIELDGEADDDDLGLSLPQDFGATFGAR